MQTGDQRTRVNGLSEANRHGTKIIYIHIVGNTKQWFTVASGILPPEARRYLANYVRRMGLPPSLPPGWKRRLYGRRGRLPLLILGIDQDSVVDDQDQVVFAVAGDI